MHKNSISVLNKFTLLAGTAGLALTLALGGHAMAQSKGSGGSGHDSGSSHESGAGHDSGSSHEGGSGGKKMGKGASGERGGGRGGSLRDVFKEMEADAAEEAGHGGGHDSSSGGKKQSGKKAAGGGSTTTQGKKGGKPATTAAEAEEEEDSDRPEWAGTQGKDGKPGRGNESAGTMKGTLFGDMYVLLRDENGVPIPITIDGVEYVQPIDSEGNPIPLDAEGAPINPELAMEVELGRQNVGRSPKFVLSTRYEEAIAAINDADEVTVDPSGRLMLITNDDPATTEVDESSVKTIDAPLENLALYVELMNTGTLAGVLTEATPDDPTTPVDESSPPVFSADLQNLIDGVYTTADLDNAATLFAAAADKTGTVLVDNVVYMNSILDITGTIADPLDDSNQTEYVDYSDFSYDRLTTWGTVTADVLIYDPNTGNWVPTNDVNIMEAVFGGTNETLDDAAGFAQSADDALQVIEFIHEYALPAEQTMTN
jgi:hypothetical protein